MNNSLGIHHITAIASNPSRCVDFYTKILGLRLVKKSINQDQVEAYHLFFGDKMGEPGMDLTFFTFDPIIPGRRGVGVVSLISLGVREKVISFWKDRFDKYGVKYNETEDRFGKKRIMFFDSDDQRLELVGLDEAEYESSVKEQWQTVEISEQESIASFHSARLSVINKQDIDLVLTKVLGFEEIGGEIGITLYALNGQSRAQYVEVEEGPVGVTSIGGAGSVHHIAFQVRDEKHLIELRNQVLKIGLFPTQVIDRYYFKSVYFRTPAGILFELATNGPGFTIDEDLDHLGEKLSIPPFLESRRQEIEAGLEPI